MDETFTPEQYEQLCEIVEQAESLVPTERDAFLETACNGDLILLRKSREMLSHRANLATGFLRGTGPVSLKSAAASQDHDPLIGQQCGQYQINCRIDSGGMGTVYRAERLSDYRETVAIKVIRAGLNSAEFVQRFRTERQVLAGLRHPNVATLLDGGTLDDGRPYLVMEYIEGEAITRFCDRHKLTIDQRLHLIKLAAAGVQHAHQRAVLHRDLKPGNILVTPKGAVKLVDFGIAKLTRPEAFGQQPFQTQLTDRALTPQYASPEQIRDQAPLMASDVYSLGVVLYELLAGSLPYELAGLTWSQIERIVCEAEPPKPSAAIGGTRASPTDAAVKNSKLLNVSDSRRMAPRELRRKLSGDLDNIVLKALRKEPDRRYATAEQLVADLERYRKGLPVIAQMDSRLYRTKKFVYRNRLAVLAATLVLLSLVTGLIGTGVGLRRTMRAETKAVRRFDEIRTLATTSVFDIHDRIAELPGSTPVRDFVVGIGIEYLDNLAQETGEENPGLLHELTMAYIRAGDAAGSPWRSSLGNHTRALDAYRKANQLAERLVDSNPDNATYFHTWLAAQVAIADLLGVTQPIKEAYDEQLDLTQVARKKSIQYADETKWQQCYLHCLIRLGRYADWQGRTQESLRLLEEAMSVAKRNVERWPDDPESHRGLYRILIGASVLDSKGAKSAAALQHINEAIDVIEGLQRRGVATREDLFARGSMELQLGELYWRASRGELAEKSFRTATEVYGRLASEDQRNRIAQTGSAESEANLARIMLLVNKRNEEAMKLAEQAYSRLQPFCSERHGPILVAAASICCLRGDCYVALGKQAEAEAAYQEGVGLADDLLASDGHNIDYMRSWSQVRRNLAYYYSSQGKSEDGLANMLPVVKLLDSLRSDHSSDMWYLDQWSQTTGALSSIYGNLNRWTEGIANAEEALRVADTLAKREPNYTRRSGVARALNQLALLHYARSEESNADQVSDLASAAKYLTEEAKLWDGVFAAKLIPDEQIQLARTMQTECADLLLEVNAELSKK